LDELIQVFPHRSRDLAVRDARLRLLPHLRELETQEAFGTAGQEEFVLDRELQADPARRREMNARWRALVPALLDLCRTPDAAVDRLIDVITRGATLFAEASPYSNRISLQHALARASSMYRFAPAPLVELHQMYDDFVPKSRRAFALRLDRLLAFVHVSRTGDQLKPEVAEYLFERDSTYVRSLKGHREPSSTDWRARIRGRPRTYSPVLDRLLTKDALKSYRFISIA
jgi:hypothetical protein